MTVPEKYRLIGLRVSPSEFDSEGKEYEACKFELEDQVFLGRTAKITPKKNGLFVTHWKRDNDGITAPFDYLDPINFTIIFVAENKKRGYFKFPKSVLLQKGIMSTASKEGKRGFRVYPPWSVTKSKQATKTQIWQITHFTEL